MARHNYWQNATPNGHGTEGADVAVVQRQIQIYNNTFFWAISFNGSQRSGSSIWHDNTWLGRNSPNGTHTSLGYYREYGATGGVWGFADGENGWDKNDPHGLYKSGTAASSSITNKRTRRYRYRNDNPEPLFEFLRNQPCLAKANKEDPAITGRIESFSPRIKCPGPEKSPAHLPRLDGFGSVPASRTGTKGAAGQLTCPKGKHLEKRP